jgi:hypothetical protein
MGILQNLLLPHAYYCPLLRASLESPSSHVSTFLIWTQQSRTLFPYLQIFKCISTPYKIYLINNFNIQFLHLILFWSKYLHCFFVIELVTSAHSLLFSYVLYKFWMCSGSGSWLKASWEDSSLRKK